MYYPINEEAARRAHEMNSYRDYAPGTATKEYQSLVDEAEKIAHRQKANVNPIHHDKIDRLLEVYSRKLADWYNQSSTIEQMCPSILITGGSSFPVRKKEKQNAARERHSKEWETIKGLLYKIEGIGTAGIRSDDPNALAQLKDKLNSLERHQEHMKTANKRERGSYQSWELSNNNANIRRIKGRISGLEKRSESLPQGWNFPTGKVVANADDNRLQIFFVGKPDEETRTALKRNGFRWAPSVGAWQRQLTANAISAAKYVVGAVETA